MIVRTLTIMGVLMMLLGCNPALETSWDKDSCVKACLPGGYGT